MRLTPPHHRHPRRALTLAVAFGLALFVTWTRDRAHPALALPEPMPSASSSSTASSSLAAFDVSRADFANPFVLADRDGYVAFATGAGDEHVQVARSRDLATWTRLPDALPSLPSWAARERGLTWAPAVLRRESAYVLYYTARDAASGFQCIGRATSARPEGPYLDDSEHAFVCP